MRRRGWLSREQFLDYVGAANLIPGPNSTELAIHIGHARAGWTGLFVAGISFIVPAVADRQRGRVGVRRYGTLPEAEGLLYGVKPVVDRDRGPGALEPGACGGQDGWRSRCSRSRRSSRRRWASTSSSSWRCSGAAAAVIGLGGRPAPRAERTLMIGVAGGACAGTAAAIGLRRGRGPVRALAALPGLRQDRFGPVRQRLRAARVSARGPRRAARLAHRAAADRCGRDRPGHARAGLHDRDVHRLPARWSRRRRGGDSRHLPARVRVRGAERPAGAAPAAVAARRRRRSMASTWRRWR